MSESSYFDELEKIANEVIVDEMSEPMTEDPKPSIPAEEVEAAQAANSEADSAAAEEQNPPSPEDAAELDAAVQVAQEDLEAAQEQLAQAEHEYQEFEKTAAPLISESLPAMGAFAKLIDFSTNPDSDPVLHKLAQERLQNALSSEEAFIETLQKTAMELFEDEQNLNALYTEDGMDYVVETLNAFAEDEDLSKQAFEGGAVLGKAIDTIKEFGSATKNFWKLKKELDIAKVEAERLTNIARQATDDLATGTNNPNTPDEQLIQLIQADQEANTAAQAAQSAVSDTRGQVIQGGVGQGLIGGGLAGGALFGGKKLYDATQSGPEDELSMKTAGVKMKPQKSDDYHEGGKIKMAQTTIVPEFLKIAGAAALLNIANDEGFKEEIRKEAADQFNTISRMSRKDMEDSFVKVATELYTEDQLHSIVAGNHNEELFDKIAFFLAANDASADELEKVAGADGVAAKGVAGALTDAHKQVEAHIQKEKKDAETGNLNPGATKAQDTSGLNVINNPQKYNVDKTANMIERAQMQKQAAIEAYAEAENFLSQFSH